MAKFLVVLAAMLLVSCAEGSPPAAQVRADYARIDPRCKNISIDNVERDDRGVWVTITEKCHSASDAQMQLLYKKRGGQWTVVWYAPVLYD